DLSIKKSSRFLPSLTAWAIQRGIAPRPAQVSPPGPRYLGATFWPFIALLPRRPRPRPTPASSSSAANCCCSSVAFRARERPTSSRNCKRASTDIVLRFILAIWMLQTEPMGDHMDQRWQEIVPKSKRNGHCCFYLTRVSNETVSESHPI